MTGARGGGGGGGDQVGALHSQSPSVSHRKDCTGTYHAKVKCQRILQKPRFFPIYLAAFLSGNKANKPNQGQVL